MNHLCLIKVRKRPWTTRWAQSQRMATPRRRRRPHTWKMGLKETWRSRALRQPSFSPSALSTLTEQRTSARCLTTEVFSSLIVSLRLLSFSFHLPRPLCVDTPPPSPLLPAAHSTVAIDWDTESKKLCYDEQEAEVSETTAVRQSHETIRKQPLNIHANMLFRPMRSTRACCSPRKRKPLWL